MRINPRKPLMYVEDRLRQIKAYLKHPDTDIKYVLYVLALFCVVLWFVIIGEWLKGVAILGGVVGTILSYSTFYCWGVLIVTVIRKKRVERKLARNTAITTVVLVSSFVVFDVPSDVARTVLMATALWATAVIVLQLFKRK